MTWIKNFLTKRTQQVVIEGIASSPTTVLSGVPQGTVLGPLFFLLYINDISVDSSSTIRLLADDCIMYKEIHSSQDSLDLQKDLDRLQRWEQQWQMRLNKDKCFVMQVSHKKNPIKTSYRIGDTTLESVTDHTYLGIQLNSKLSWANHIRGVSSKGNQILGLLRRNLFSCSTKVKSIAYKTLVRPRLEYCASVWDPYQKEYINQLEAVQRRSARFVLI